MSPPGPVVVHLYWEVAVSEDCWFCRVNARTSELGSLSSVGAEPSCRTPALEGPSNSRHTWWCAAQSLLLVSINDHTHLLSQAQTIWLDCLCSLQVDVRTNPLCKVLWVSVPGKWLIPQGTPVHLDLRAQGRDAVTPEEIFTRGRTGLGFDLPEPRCVINKYHPACGILL